MVWRNTTEWLLDLKLQQDTIIFGLVARANGTCVNEDPTVLSSEQKNNSDKGTGHIRDDKPEKEEED